MPTKPHPNTGNEYAKKDNPAISRIELRCRPKDKARWERKAKREGKSLSQWIIDRLG